MLAASFTGENSFLLSLVSWGIFFWFPMLMILLVTWHVMNRDRRQGRCSRCANIRRNRQWVKNGHRH